MRSLRGRLTIIVAGLALLAVAAVTVIVAITTNDALEETLADQREARAEIVGELNELALQVDSWAEARDVATELAEAFDARIVLTDIDGRRLVDTGEGELPPLEGVVDPFGPLAEFTSEVPFDEKLFTDTLIFCLEEEEIPFEIDDDGEVFLFDEGFDDDIDDLIDGCYDEAVFSIEEGDLFGINEPALLFIGFSSAPSIPWVAVALIATAVVAGAGLVAAPLSSFVTRSLRSLTAAARSVREGNLAVRVEAESPSEVADLASSFNEMTAELERAEVRRKQVTADVAHELRSPLTNILGHLDAIEDGVIEPTPDQVGIITSEAARLSHLVDDLQTLAAIDEETLVLQQTSVDVTGVIDRAIEARRTRALEKQINLVRTGADEAPAEIDPVRFEQVIGNLLDNALEHTPVSGEVEIEVVDEPDTVQVRVADTGPGIEPELLPFVFDRLSRADPSRSPGKGGRGLGLTIARGLARAHGGEIEARHREEGGALLVVTIPHRHRP